MSRATIRSVAAIAAIALAAWCLAATAALAATPTAPDAGGDIDVQAWPEGGRLIVVAAITVPPDVSLPVKVRIPVPDNATVQWVGEVLGGALSADPARPYEIVKSPVGGRYAEFMLEETRSAQVDADMPALTQSGDDVSASFDWVQSTVSPFTSFSVRVPASASNVQISPQPAGPADVNDAGELLYSSDRVKLEPGTTQRVTFSYSTSKRIPTTQAAGGTSVLVVTLSIALVTAVAALVFVVVRQRRAAESGPPV